MTQKKILMIGFFLLFFTVVYSQEIRWLKLYGFQGDLSASAESLDETIGKASDSLSYDYSENFLKYSLGLNFRGYVYHPYFLEFSVDSNLILNDAKTEIFSDSQAYKDFNNRYNINFFVLKKKPVHLMLYFKNNENTYPRVYYGRFFNYAQTNGFKIISNLKKIPFVFDFNHNSVISQSLLYYDRRESSNNFKFESDLIDKKFSSLSLSATYKNYNESVFLTHYISTNAMVVWNKAFENKEFGLLNAHLTFRKIDGQSFLETKSGNLNYIKPIGKNLSFVSTLSFLNSKTQSLKRNFSAIDFNFKHNLYLSLTSSAKFSFQKEASDSNTISRSIAFFSVNYKKRIPTGRINLKFIQLYQNVTNSSEGKLALSQLYAVFDSGDTIRISQNGIVPSSIKVLSKDGTKVYIEGIDYNLIVSESAVVITRLYGGGIDEGETVLIVFDYNQFPDYKTLIHNYEDSLSIDIFKYLTVGGSIKKSNNTVISDFIITPFEEFTLRERFWGFKSKKIFYRKSRSKYYGSFSEYKFKTENFKISYRFQRIIVGYYFLKYNLNFLSIDYFSNFKNNSVFLSGTFFQRINFQFNYRKLDYNQTGFVRKRESVVCNLSATVRKLRVEFFYEHILDDSNYLNKKHDYYRFTVRRFF
ncbi:hypothetical protein TTHT_1314 [Thermotomaculum hydrothermale]|uniref:Uncharacterized protein n=1 Tax=Thermotomaculum hydrothermale TaxID=981385 RepID=A0A7R6PR62_9BACT|nr:hypothetical protein [Thermotomaculum hydrothermale]BBB32831.1 hypothetical protein TTHT_1314 [Thermotomaculum hydrothermale]